jgi:GAF domain-containing protein
MENLNRSDELTEQRKGSGQNEKTTAKTQELPRALRETSGKQTEIAIPDEAAFQAGQKKVSEMIEANAPLADVLTNLVLLLEAQSPEMLCSVLLLSDDGDHIRHGAAPSLPEQYIKAIDGEPIGPKNGSCGTAMWRGKPVVVTDVTSDPLWEDYRDLAIASGLGACWSTPILTKTGKVLGSFAMYYREPRAPTGAEARLTEVATRLAGKAIEQRNAQRVTPTAAGQ